MFEFPIILEKKRREKKFSNKKDLRNRNEKRWRSFNLKGKTEKYRIEDKKSERNIYGKTRRAKSKDNP